MATVLFEESPLEDPLNSKGWIIMIAKQTVHYGVYLATYKLSPAKDGTDREDTSFSREPGDS